jgi:hypothetical protein
VLRRSRAYFSLKPEIIGCFVGTYQRDDVCQRAQKYADSALHMNLLNTLRIVLAPAERADSNAFGTYHFRHHASIKLEIAYTLPVQVHIELNAISLGPVDIDIGEADGDVTKVDLDETKISKRTREGGGKNGFNSLFDDVGACDAYVGPEVLDNVVEEA